MLKAIGVERQIITEKWNNPKNSVRIKGARESGGDIVTFVKNGEEVQNLYTEESDIRKALDLMVVQPTTKK